METLFTSEDVLEIVAAFRAGLAAPPGASVPYLASLREEQEIDAQ